jgi:hypothetical protein
MWSRSRPLRRFASRAKSAAPRLEVLEGRALLSTLTVMNNLDHGPGSLRATIAAASSGDTIVFARSVHTITLTSGELSIARSLDIEGPGANQLTISGGGTSRVFEIGHGATVTLANLTVANGKVSGVQGGGGILNDAGATLNLNHSSVVSNRAIGSAGSDVFGGGLLNLGNATVTSSTFSGNQVLGGASTTLFGGSIGGAIDNFGGATLTVARSSFLNNQAIGGDGGFGVGGAIENDAGPDFHSQPSTAIITDSFFQANLATASLGGTGNGGALDDEGVGATMTLVNSTVIGNQSRGGPGGDGETTLSQGIGGGIMNEAGTFAIINSAIVGNLSRGGDGALVTADNPLTGGGVGGGIENFGATGVLFPGNPGAVLTITDSTIVGNQARGGAEVDAISHRAVGGSAVGGGVENSFFGATLTIADGSLIGNQAIAGPGGSGGHAFATGLGAGGALDDSFNSTATLIDTAILGNQAIGSDGAHGVNGGDGWGGGIVVGLNGTPGLGFPPDTSSLTVIGGTLAGNLAQGGAGGSGAKGGDGFGGGLMIASGAATATVVNSAIVGNLALGGAPGAGGGAGQGIGGGVYTLGTFTDDPSTVIKKNHASTSHDNIGP